MSLHLAAPKIAGVPLKPGRSHAATKTGGYAASLRGGKKKNAGNPQRARQRATCDSWRLVLSSAVVCLRERCRFFSFIQPSDYDVFDAQSWHSNLSSELSAMRGTFSHPGIGGGVSEKIEMHVRLPPALCDPAGACGGLWGPADAIAPFAAAALVKLRR